MPLWPFTAFLQRAYDQLIHDVALQNLPVLFAIDRAGVVGADGETHQGAYDLSFLRCIPNLVIMAPSDLNECRQMLYTGHLLQQPAAVRYPRGSAGSAEVSQAMTALEVGKAKVVREGENSHSKLRYLTRNATEVATELNATLVDMRFVKPLDTALLDELVGSHERFVTLEDNAIAGGAGSAVIEYFAAQGYSKPVKLLGLPDEFIKHGTQGEIHAELGLSSDGIREQINRWMQ